MKSIFTDYYIFTFLRISPDDAYGKDACAGIKHSATTKHTATSCFADLP